MAMENFSAPVSREKRMERKIFRRYLSGRRRFHGWNYGIILSWRDGESCLKCNREKYILEIYIYIWIIKNRVWREREREHV